MKQENNFSAYQGGWASCPPCKRDLSLASFLHNNIYSSKNVLETQAGCLRSLIELNSHTRKGAASAAPFLVV